MGRILFLIASVVCLLRLLLPYAVASPRLALLLLTPYLACVTFTGARAWSAYMTVVAARPPAVRAVRQAAVRPRQDVRRARVLSPLDLCRAAA